MLQPGMRRQVGDPEIRVISARRWPISFSSAAIRSLSVAIGSADLEFRARGRIGVQVVAVVVDELERSLEG